MSPTLLMTLVLPLGLSLLLGGVFLAAALPKLRHPKGFLLTVLEYRILGEGASRLYTLLVPPVELLAALLLFSGVAVQPTAAVLALLLVSFLVAVGVNVVRGRDLDCGCFGSGQGKTRSRRIGPGLLIEDVGLLAGALFLAAMAPGWLEPAPWSVARLVARLVGTPVAVVVVIAGCLVAAAWVTVALRRTGARRSRKRAGIVARVARR